VWVSLAEEGTEAISCRKFSKAHSDSLLFIFGSVDDGGGVGDSQNGSEKSSTEKTLFILCLFLLLADSV